MKKRILALLMVMVLAVMGLAACGSDSDEDSSSDEGSSEDEEVTSEVIGSDSEDAVELEMWTFIDQHKNFFETMVTRWNKNNPDRELSIKVNVMPYEEMHNKLQIALQAGGEGAPDIVDIEVGKFPNFTQGDIGLYDLTEVAEPYRDDLVEARMDLYAKDGVQYGFPTHVGATVAFYNVELLEEAGIDYTEIVTWEDYKEAGAKYKEETGLSFGTADTFAVWSLELMMAQKGLDWLDDDGNVNVNNDEIIELIEYHVEMQEAGAIDTIAGGQPDTEEAKGAFNSGDYAAQIMPLWQMGRFTDEMTDLEGKIAIAAAPVFEDGVAQSVGGGGTGTAVVKTSEEAELAAEFLAYAKLSEDANRDVWDVLGFDPCNMSLWDDEELTHNEDNKYNQYFVTNAFDVLNEIKDGIAGLDSKTSPKAVSINDYMVNTALNEIFEDGMDVKEVMDYAQDVIANEVGDN